MEGIVFTDVGSCQKVGPKLRVKRKFLKKIFLIFLLVILISFIAVKQIHKKNLENLETVLAKVDSQKLTVDDLLLALGGPEEDTYQQDKLYNLDQSKEFNCERPFRYISYHRSFLIFFELKLEDNLHFYFDKNGKFCFFERNGL